jgi:putative transposase
MISVTRSLPEGSLRTDHSTITSGHVPRCAADRLQAARRLPDHGRKCTAAAALTILFWAAARITSRAAACTALLRAPSDQAVRDALLATRPAFAARQRRLNRALAGGLPRVLQRRAPYVALDLVLLPSYGRPQDGDEELYRGPKKAGPNQFHAYATASVICRGCRSALALRAVHHADPWDAVVGDRLRQVRRVGVKVRLLLLDRGFYSVGVLRSLQAARCPFLRPAIRRGRKPDDPAGPSGTWAFTTRKRSGWARSTPEGRNDRRRARVTIAVCCHRRPERTRSGRRVRQRDVVWL